MIPDLVSKLNKGGSGLNLRELAQTLATAETAPQITRLQRARDNDELRLSGLTQLRSQFDAMGDTLVRGAGNPVLTVTSSSSALQTRVTDRAALTPGSVALDVTHLARPQVLEFEGFSSANQILSAGRLTLDFGSWHGDDFSANPDRDSLTLTLSAGTSLSGLAETLNRLPGVIAQILDKGDGTVSLGILSETGAANALRITTEATGTEHLALDVFDTTNSNGTRQIQAAQDAEFSVNGITLTRASNTVSGILPGLDITLKAPVSGTLTIGRDADAARANIQTLVEGLNDTLDTLRRLTGNGSGEGQAGELAGDRNLQSLETALRRLIAQPLDGFADRPVSLADLGIATERTGRLRFDPPAFDRNFAANAAHFDALFENKLRMLSGQAEVSGTPNQMLPAGDYQFARDASGNATLDGFRMSSFQRADGSFGHTVLEGPARGLSITTPEELTSDTLRFGRSFAESLAILLDNAVSRTGLIGRRETEIDQQATQRTDRIEQLEARAALVEKRYLSRFAAMEQAVSRMNSSASYLQNLVDIWANQRR